jgi:hypothetical protein
VGQPFQSAEWLSAIPADLVVLARFACAVMDQSLGRVFKRGADRGFPRSHCAINVCFWSTATLNGLACRASLAPDTSHLARKSEGQILCVLRVGIDFLLR